MPLDFQVIKKTSEILSQNKTAPVLKLSEPALMCYSR